MLQFSGAHLTESWFIGAPCDNFSSRECLSFHVAGKLIADDLIELMERPVFGQ